MNVTHSKSVLVVTLATALGGLLGFAPAAEAHGWGAHREDHDRGERGRYERGEARRVAPWQWQRGRGFYGRPVARVWVGHPPLEREWREGRFVAYVPGTYGAPAAMWDEDFAGLLAAVRTQPFASERLAMIRDVAAQAYFTTTQARELVASVPFSGQRVEAALALYPQVIDPWRFYAIYELVPFYGDRENLRRGIAAFDAERNYRAATPMPPPPPTPPSWPAR